MSEFKHWCGNCQIRVYNERHYGKLLSWQDCPYTCEYGTAMRCSTKPPDTATCNTESDIIGHDMTLSSQELHTL